MPSQPPTTAEVLLEALADTPGRSASQLAEALGLGRSTVTKCLARLEAQGLATRVAGGRESGQARPDTWSCPPPRQGQPRASEATGASRLAKGELAKLVADYLDRHPGAHGPSAIAKELDRSAGAVANALVRLVDEVEAVLVTVAPRRYQSAKQTEQTEKSRPTRSSASTGKRRGS